MVSTSLIDNLIKNGLQPFIYKDVNKRGYFNNAYFENKKITGETFGNTPFIFDFKKYQKYNATDASVGITFKNENIRDKNNGFVMFDFDLKGNDDITVFDDIVSKLKELELWEQVEIKRNGKGYHLVLKINPEELETMGSDCKIHRGESSFLEIITSGKFVRLCPNKDYILDNTEGKHIIFDNCKYISINTILSFSKRSEDRILNESTYIKIKKISVERVNFEITDLELKTENEKLLYAYIRSKKLDYDIATKLAYGLGVYKYTALFNKTIPKQKQPEYIRLFENGYNSGYKTTQFMNELLTGLHINKNKIQIESYIPQEKIEEILTNKKKHVLISAPTGSGKTTAILNAALKLNLNVIFTVPNKAVVAQIKKERGFELGASYENIPIKEQMEIYNVVVSTINKLEQIPDHWDLSNYILICDEKHTHVTTVGFRAEHIYMINKMKARFKKVIDVTATVEPLYLEEYEEKIYFIKKDTKKYDINITVTELEKKEKTKNKRKSSANSKRVLIDLLKKYKDTRCIVLNNDIAFNDVYAEQNQDIYLSLNSKTKKSEHYSYILEHQKIPDNIKVLLTTDLFSAGLNLLNKDEIIVIINGFIDPTLIKQFVARFRILDRIKVEIIVSPREIKHYYRDGMIEFLKKQAQEKYERLKQENGAIFYNKGVIQDDFFIYDKHTKHIEIFNERIYQATWDNYNRHSDYKNMLICFDEDTYKVTINSNSLANEYDIKQAVKDEKENRKEIKRQKKEKTIEYIKEMEYEPRLIEHYFDEEIHCEHTLNYFLDLFEVSGLKYDMCIKFLEDEMYEEYVRHALITRYAEKDDIKKTDFIKMVLHIYKHYEVGKTLKITEICERNNYNKTRYKNALESLWITEKRRTGTERYLEIVERRKLQLTNHEMLYLYRSDRFGKTFFNEISDEAYEKFRLKE